MKKKILIPMTLLVLMSITILSCSQDNETFTGDEDANLITSIEEATNKQSIVESQLPDAALTIVSTEFAETFVSEALKAEEYGYKVIMRTDDPVYFEERFVVYFDMTGRKLLDSDRRHDGIDRCFRFVYPFTVTHINGEVLEILNHQQLKRVIHSCDRRRHCFRFNYPINLAFGDRLIEINSNEELRRAFHRCDRTDRPRDVRPHD